MHTIIISCLCVFCYSIQVYGVFREFEGHPGGSQITLLQKGGNRRLRLKLWAVKIYLNEIKFRKELWMEPVFHHCV